MSAMSKRRSGAPRSAPRGAGEAGTVGAPAAVLLAVNDALRPLGAQVSSLPITPEAVLNAIAAAA